MLKKVFENPSYTVSVTKSGFRRLEKSDREICSEHRIEVYLVKSISALGGICLKYSSASTAGFPDRLCVLPSGVTVWCELKSKGKRPRKLQEQQIGRLRALGHSVYVCDSYGAVDAMVNDVKNLLD